MKLVQGSSRGRGGGGGGYRGRGRGGGGGGRGGGRGRGGGGDKRFAARFTDPRFQLSRRVEERRRRGGRGGGVTEEDIRKDERFAKHFAREMSEEEEEEEEDEERSQEASSEERSDAETSSNGSEEGKAAGEEEHGDESDDSDDEVEAWKPDEVSFTDAKRRVAVVNCDWDHVRAVDLYAILSNAVPLGGQLHHVSIYLSDFGRRMIEHEKTYGPNLWVRPGEEDVEDPEAAAGGAGAEPLSVTELPESGGDDDFEVDDDDEQDEKRSDGWVDDDEAMLHEEGEDGERFSSGKYRKYEMDRMRRYYAIAEFDSAETAAAVYEALDGVDIEATGVLLDLRYVEDDETFDEPVSKATCVPPNFKPLGYFSASALTQTRFRISWDQDDAFRHTSLQDSFTGTTTEDDLAAYMAPSDSDEEDAESSADAQRRERERKKIRQRYAALLEGIGGLPDEMPEDQQQDGASENSDDEDESGSGSGSSDDDSLNRFSDVDMEEAEGEEEAEEGGSDDEDGEVLGDMEATIDLDAGDRAVQLQTQARRQQKVKDADLASKAELKYRLRRKEMKKTKKQMIAEERESARAALEAQKDERKQQLKKLLDTDDNGAVRRSGKQKRKEHAREVKQRVAAERAAHKKALVAERLGIARELRGEQESAQAQAALDTIDERFRSKLVSDPRFQIDVAQRDKRVSDDVAQLASTVALARRAAKRSAPDSAAANSGNDTDSTVEYFLNRPTKRPRL